MLELKDKIKLKEVAIDESFLCNRECEECICNFFKNEKQSCKCNALELLYLLEKYQRNEYVERDKRKKKIKKLEKKLKKSKKKYYK